MKILFFKAVGVLIVLMLSLGQALAAGPVGYAQSVIGEVVAFQNDDGRTLKNKSPVYQQDTVVTRSGGKAQIMFEDGMQLSIAPESMIAIAAYSYSSALPGSDILKFIFGPGFFRLLTGKLVRRNPERFNVSTPYGTLGIRGTQTASLIQVQGSSNADLVNSVASGADAKNLMDGLSAMNFQEEHAHVVKTGRLGLYYTFGATKQATQIPVSKMVTVSREGVSEPSGISGAMAKAMAKTAIDPNMETPGAYDTGLTPADMAEGLGNNSGSSGRGDGDDGGGHSDGDR